MRWFVVRREGMEYDFMGLSEAKRAFKRGADVIGVEFGGKYVMFDRVLHRAGADAYRTRRVYSFNG